MSGFGLQADFYNSLTPADIEIKELKEKLTEMEKKIDERPKGKWIIEENNKDYPNGRATCSHCGYKMDVKRWEWLSAVRWYLKPNYCPNCGADMRWMV